MSHAQIKLMNQFIMLHATYGIKAAKHTKLVLYVLLFLYWEKIMC